MSSSIDSLFGSVENVESNVSKLFSTSTGPVSNVQIKTKKRTIIPNAKKNEGPKKTSESSVQEDQTKEGDSSEEKSSGEDEHSGEEELQEPVKKKQKKAKTDEDEDAQLEERYFSKLMGENTDADDKQDPKTVPNIERSSESNTTKATKVDLKEDELEKAKRTLFVGNLSNEVITSKTTYKKFKKLFSTNPAQKGDENEKEVKGEDALKFTIESIRFRSISFDEALPRKVAFAQNKLHKSRESVNAYIVYSNDTIIKKMCSNLNGGEFMSRHLRVDSVTHPAPHDNKRSIFVGNLDFEEDEESLWSHFGTCGDIEYVRIVRDSKTNLGKGFAYVQFKDFQSVNKALLLNEKVMKSLRPNGKNRKLRVSRCKNIRKQATYGGKSRANEANLHENQRTKVGRAKKVLGRADRATIGQNITIEGQRASKKDGSSNSILKKKKQRSKTGRVTKRSQAFKNSQASSN